MPITLLQKLILQVQKYFDFIKVALPLYTSVGWLHYYQSQVEFTNLNHYGTLKVR
jgi:hypothetical protein